MRCTDEGDTDIDYDEDAHSCSSDEADIPYFPGTSSLKQHAAKVSGKSSQTSSKTASKIDDDSGSEHIPYFGGESNLSGSRHHGNEVCNKLSRTSFP